jgi:fumarylacetoacetate (FAA) hydrolase
MMKVSTMRLATLRDGSRDGTLVVVDRPAQRMVRATTVAPTLQAALDDWDHAEPRLRALAAGLEAADGGTGSQPLHLAALEAPLPRAYEWIDASSYLNHVRLVRRARGVPPPENLETEPLIYQGGSGVLLAPRAPLELPDPSWGLDFESELCVVVGDVPRGADTVRAAAAIRLLMLANDVTYRALVPPELQKGFGFFASKPATAFGPFAVTPDELGSAWHDGRAHLRVRTTLNNQLVGDVDSGPEMHFSFPDLIAFIAKTRAFVAGTILGSGTVSNQDRARGVSCLVERRTIETLEGGGPRTPYLKEGDTVTIEAFDGAGGSPFGAISQQVERVTPASPDSITTAIQGRQIP